MQVLLNAPIWDQRGVGGVLSGLLDGRINPL